MSDAVTQVQGRLAFLEQLERLTQRMNRREIPGPVSLLLGEIDGFELMSDWYGYREVEVLHQKLLGELSMRLQEMGGFRTGHILLGSCSSGGFAIALFGELASASAGIAENLWTRLHGTCILDGQPHRVSCSLGATRPEVLQDTNQLVGVARTALRRAVDLGGNRMELGQHRGAAAHARMRILGRDLQTAIAQKQLRLEYQPIIDLQNMKMEGVEALLRWNHPVLGPVPPSEFIPVAAQCGYLGALGDWVLQNACLEFVHLRSDSRLHDVKFVSVNVSRQSLGDRNLGQRVMAALSAAQMEPGQLHLEITESELCVNAVAAAGNMREIRGLGVKLAIDDFGVGYSSLASLHQFPVDMLKLDRTFLTRDFTGNHGSGMLAIAHAIVNLARNVDLRVVAEGVETAEQVALLQSMECPLAQGYFLSRPMSLAELPRFRPGC